MKEMTLAQANIFPRLVCHDMIELTYSRDNKKASELKSNIVNKQMSFSLFLTRFRVV